MISKNHSNRRLFNYSVYDASDRCLIALKGKIRGDVYDLGCGEMPYRDWILGLPGVAKYVGVDWGNTLHQLKAEIIADLNQPLPISSESADTVISLSVMEHLCEPQSFLHEANRILKANGSIILQVPFMWKVHEAPYDYFRFTKFGLEHLFQKAGFREIEVIEQSGFWVTWTLKLNYYIAGRIRGPWLIRKPLAVLARLIWIVDQPIAKSLDRFSESGEETCGYYVVATK